jgi:hypothetical protein
MLGVWKITIAEAREESGVKKGKRVEKERKERIRYYLQKKPFKNYRMRLNQNVL